MKGTPMIAENSTMSTYRLRQRRKHRDIRSMSLVAGQTGGAV